MHDYKELNDHGLADASEQETPSRPTKKSQQSSQPVKALQATEVEDDYETDNEKQKKKDKRRAWFWKYFEANLLQGTYNKGRGKHKKKEQDVLYKCFDFKKCGFSRQLSHTHGATDSFSKHLEVKHKIFKDIEEM